MCTRLYITPYYPTYLTVVNCALLSKSPIKQLCTLVTLHASFQLGFAKICILLWLLSLFLDSPLNSSLTTFKWRVLWNFEAEIIFQLKAKGTMHMHGSREELESGRTEWMQWTLNHNLYYSWRTRALVLVSCDAKTCESRGRLLEDVIAWTTGCRTASRLGCRHPESRASFTSFSCVCCDHHLKKCLGNYAERCEVLVCREKSIKRLEYHHNTDVLSVLLPKSVICMEHLF